MDCLRLITSVAEPPPSWALRAGGRLPPWIYQALEPPHLTTSHSGRCRLETDALASGIPGFQGRDSGAQAQVLGSAAQPGGGLSVATGKGQTGDRRDSPRRSTPAPARPAQPLR